MGLIRLMLALTVACDHFTVINLARIGFPEGAGGVNQWIGFTAGYAVCCFYVLSGFLISYVLAHKYPEGLGGTKRFFRSRFIRIYSLYWPALILCIVLFPHGMDGRGGIQYLVSFVIVGGDWVLAFQNYPLEQTPFPDALGQMWSVAAELTFYGMAPWLLRSLRGTIALFGGSLLLRVVLESHFGIHQAWDYHFFPPMLWFFLIGHLGRLAHDWGARLPIIRLTSGQVINLPVIGSLILLIVAHRLLSHATVGGYIASPWFYDGIFVFALALPAIFEATKDNRFLNFCGNISYPIYISHMVVLTMLAPIGDLPLPFATSCGAAAPLVTVVLFGLLMVVVGSVVHVVVEKPAVWGMNVIFDRFSRRAVIAHQALD